MGRGVVWDLGVINHALSLPDQQLVQEYLALRDSPSLAESLRGFLMAVCMQDEEVAGLPSSGASSPPFLLPDKLRGIDRL